MEMDEVAVRWVMKTALKNYWRIYQWYDLEDLIADGHMWWYSRVKKYPHITERRHMMRMFQIRYTQHIHDLANKRTRQVSEDRAYDFNAGPAVTRRADGSIAPLDQCVAEAPLLVKRVLQKLLSMDDQTLSARFKVRSDGTRETLNERLCRLIGVDPAKTNIARDLHSYLTS